MKEEIELLENRKNNLEKVVNTNPIRSLESIKQAVKYILTERIQTASKSSLEKICQEYIKKITPISSNTALLEMDVVRLHWLHETPLI